MIVVTIGQSVEAALNEATRIWQGDDAHLWLDRNEAQACIERFALWGMRVFEFVFCEQQKILVPRCV